MVGGFSACVNALYNFSGSRNAVTLEPEQNIGFPAHGADVNHLLQSEQMGRHAGVDGVGEFDVVFLEGFDDGRGVDSGGGADSVFADHGVVSWDANAGGA